MVTQPKIQSKKKNEEIAEVSQPTTEDNLKNLATLVVSKIMPVVNKQGEIINQLNEHLGLQKERIKILEDKINLLNEKIELYKNKNGD